MDILLEQENGISLARANTGSISGYPGYFLYGVSGAGRRISLEPNPAAFLVKPISQDVLGCRLGQGDQEIKRRRTGLRNFDDPKQDIAHPRG